MPRNEFLATRLREVFIDGHWIANTNYKEQLLNTGWKQATSQLAELNTIAHLVFHINYYLEGLIHVFKGGQLEIRDKYSFDLPTIQSEQDWNKLVKCFLTNAETFVKEVYQMPDSKFDETFVDEKYGTYLRNIEGILEHSYYHLGQISLLKKLIVESDS